ncbi:hypothetical protein K435DRAFT_868296 [Dendrothele bispora CBS 962.96]|uniref:Methyltransferase-domain-containing protein n=1 Tax=Dendrothele bispora (strain CBS 962.96) TaxID=1314807 RepID=A0A4S8LC23_DENBC|nr:hypothetical protein K435DRAFT_868296 [Dendrothele bispora CBS 962.96]
MQPAHKTKQIPSLPYRIANFSFTIRQSDNGKANGTALWLGAQCLSLYLLAYKPATRVIELGSGTGLTALVLASLGWKEVYATDTSLVIDSVLSQNVANNPVPGTIHVRELDWQVPPDCWIWNDDRVVASVSTSIVPSASASLKQPFDLIITADTVYEPSLVQPLFRTIHALCTQSCALSPKSRAPPVLLCLERRDPTLIDAILEQATTEWHFSVDRVPSRKLSKAMQKDGLDWDRTDWEGVEIWKLSL